ncbi:MAG: hypothetical protein E7Z64_02645 [Thermoplasmata archaeon]|nr:hypothetical protein [Thermoplasmata archaeon]
MGTSASKIGNYIGLLSAVLFIVVAFMMILSRDDDLAAGELTDNAQYVLMGAGALAIIAGILLVLKGEKIIEKIAALLVAVLGVVAVATYYMADSMDEEPVFIIEVLAITALVAILFTVFAEKVRGFRGLMDIDIVFFLIEGVFIVLMFMDQNVRVCTAASVLVIGFWLAASIGLGMTAVATTSTVENADSDRKDEELAEGSEEEASADEASAEEAGEEIAEEAPVEESAEEEAPVEEAAEEETSEEETSEDQAAEEAPVEEAPAEEKPEEKKPNNDFMSKLVSSKDANNAAAAAAAAAAEEEAPVEEAAEEAPAEEPVEGEISLDEAGDETFEEAPAAGEDIAGDSANDDAVAAVAAGAAAGVVVGAAVAGDDEDEEEEDEYLEDTFTDYSPEALVRRAAWNKGLRCRRDYGDDHIPVAFVKGKVAVFVEDPATADTSIDSKLEADGWVVIRYDENQITDGLDQGAEIAAAVKANIRAMKAAKKKKKPAKK